MANHIPQEPPENFHGDLELLMSIFAGFVWRGMTAEQAVEQVAQYGADMAPGIAAGVDPRAGVTEFFRLLGRAMWNATPLPEHDFRLMKLPQPGRNDPCFCGSLRKFKQCCAGMPEFPMEPALMLEKLLQVMPRKYWAGLAHSQVNRDWVLAVAYQWREAGDWGYVVNLLEPWFKGEGAIPDQDAELLDLLLDTYLQLDKPRKRKSLAQAAIARGGKEARYVGWQRMALMEMDAGNITASQAALKEAMRASPDNPDLALLDVQLLLAGGQFDAARDRARFWLARLTRMRDPNLSDMMGWMRQIIADPHAAMMKAAVRGDSTLGELEAMIANIAAPQCHYRLQPLDGSTGPFEPDAKLAKALEQWEAVFPVSKPLSTVLSSHNDAAWDNADDWLDVLRGNPVLWDSFEVLDDLVCALDGYGMAGAVDVLIPTLLLHAEMLFDLVLNQYQAAHLKCEWGWMENRPALRLLARMVLDNEESPDPAVRETAFNLMRRMVEQINPHDNHGLRASVVAGLVARGKANEAIALAEKYPNDLADMTYNHVLALYAASRLADAEQAARQAFFDHPRVGYMLIATSPRKPRIDSRGYTLGSEQEAWIYREDFLAAWQAQQSALPWLKEVARKL